MSYTSEFYKKGRRGTLSIYYTEDLTVRNPLFMYPHIPDTRTLIRIPDPAPQEGARLGGRFSVYIGREADYGVPVYWDPELVQNPLIGIIGTPGAGKSHLVKTMLVRMKRGGYRDIPIIVVDPEDEYGVVVEQLGEGIVLRIGKTEFVNILERPFRTMPYKKWIRHSVLPTLKDTLAIGMSQAATMQALLEKTIIDVYEKVKGFDPVNPATWDRDDPTLKDVVVQLYEEEIKPVEEGRKKPGPKYQSAMRLYVRLRRWTEGEGSDFFARPSTVPLSELLKHSLVVFSIKDLPPDAKDAFTLYLFNYFYALMEHLGPMTEQEQRRQFLRLVLVFDEGWILLKKKSQAGEAYIEPLVRRARKYGFMTVIATQKYSDISETVLPLLGTVFLLNIGDGEAVRRLKESMKIPDRVANQIPILPTGAAVMARKMRATADYANANLPVVVRVESGLEDTIRLVFPRPPTPEDALKAFRRQV